VCSCPSDDVVERTTAPASASDRNVTMSNWFINFPRFSDKLQTQKLSTVRTIKKTKTFLKNLGLNMSAKLIQKMQQSIRHLP
jgi:hypothetical protein